MISPDWSDLIKVFGPLGLFSMTSKLGNPVIFITTPSKSTLRSFPTESPKVKMPPGARRMTPGWAGLWGTPSATHTDGMWVMKGEQ